MPSGQLEPVLRRLALDLPALSAAVADLVHREQESYREVSNEALALAVHRNMETAMRVLRRSTDNPRGDLEQVSETIQERFQAGIPMEEAVRAFALCIWQIHQRFLELCTEEGVDHDRVLDGSNTLWRLGDAITTRVVVLYNELNLQRSLIDAQRRGDLVRRLLAGMVSATELRDLGFDVGGRYAAVRCTCDAGLTSPDHARLETTGSRPGAAAVLAMIDGECLGLVAGTPDPPPGVLVAIGPLVPLAEVARSFELADRISHAAQHRGLTGVQGLADLTWQVAAVDQPELADLLRRRFLDPLREEGGFGAEIEASVRSYLALGLSIPRAAAEQNLHVNTLRYRLRRFGELTGADLDDPADLLDVVWAFTVATLPPRPARL